MEFADSVSKPPENSQAYVCHGFDKFGFVGLIFWTPEKLVNMV
jgi:hypothetical protein